jgi:hypothetical protein
LLGGNSAVSVAESEYEEREDRIGFIGKKGVDVDGLAELKPNEPMRILGGGVVSTDRVADVVRDKADVRLDTLGLVRVHILQHSVCGKSRSKRSRSCESDKCHAREHVSAMTLTGPGM